MSFALNDLWYGLYLLLVATIFWTLWRFVQLTNLSVSQRRVLFVLCGTVMFTPVLLPVAAVGSGLIPLGTIFLLLLSQSMRDVLGTDRDFFLLIASCTGITAVGLSLIAGQFIRRSATRASWNWTYPVYVGGVLTIAVNIVAFTVPNYEIPGRIESSIEEVYGAWLDEVEALRYITDPERRQAEASRLTILFNSDPFVVGVGLRQRSIDEFEAWGKRGSHTSRMCYSTVTTIEVSKCMGPSHWFVRRDTLRYTRRDSHNQESVVVVFDYNRLLSRR